MPSEMGNHSLISEPLKPSFPVCGTWRRVGAFVLDFLILMVFGFGIIDALQGYYGDLALYDRWIGLFALISYFGIWNSRIGNGQSPGKRILKIQVVDAKGQTISLGRSLGRSFILLSPFFVGHIIFPYQTGLQLYNSLMTMVVLTLSPGLILFYFFNERTRQSLHDFAMHSFVVRKNFEHEWITPPPTKQKQLNKAGLLMALSFMYSIYQGFLGTPVLDQTFSSREMNEIEQIYEVLNSEEDYAWAGVTHGVARSYLAVYVIFKNPPKMGDWETELKEVAQKIRRTSPLSKELDALIIQGYYGLNFGFCQVSSSFQKNFTPEYWYSGSNN